MVQFIALIMAFIALATFSHLGLLPRNAMLPKKAETFSQESVSPAQVSKPISTRSFWRPTEPTPEATTVIPSVSVKTYITSGPEEGEVIEETNKVTFEFKAKISPKDTEGRITFETKIEELDQDWKKTSSQKRTITFPAGPKEYTFLVRAKINNSIDLTPAKRTFQINTSPYSNKVKISSVHSPTSSRPSLITLGTYLKEGERINITGWKIRGDKGSFTIGKGIEKYSPYSNPPPDEDIFIERGDRIYLSSAQNPLGRGRNFRPNKCLGYFAHYRDFPISISKNCPKPKEEEISHLSPCCQLFIKKLGRCELPNYSNNYKISTDRECVSYLNENLNYGGCFRKYHKAEDFLEKKWHIYMNRNFVGKELDTLYLRDQNGILVDKHTYGCLYCK